MKKQDFSNHVRYYPAHHFVFYPIVLALLITSISFAIKESNNLWWVMSFVIFLLGWLSFMMRQHYALVLQNRVVRLEMRYRYYRLTKTAFEPVELQLSFGQLAALRFASDDELSALVEKTLAENLSPTSIKKSIVNWVPDHMRV
jgi:hypothetical protein